jgi:hypothetical protein
MVRDNDLIRRLLLLVEKHGNEVTTWIEDVAVEGYCDRQIDYHIWLLGMSGYVIIKDLSLMDETCYRPCRLTWFGHEFVNAIRDRDVWDETLDVADRTGVEALSALYDIAKTIATRKVEGLADVAV